MNIFDGVICLGLVVALVMGYRAGLLRSAMTIIGYLMAMPIAVWATSLLAPSGANNFGQPLAQGSLFFFAIFLVSGIVLGSLLRMAVNDMIGSDIGLGDRLAGAALGAGRILLVAVAFVLIFDRMLPAARQPFYLTSSQLRPILSQAGQMGFKSLPPEVTAYIDQLKRDNKI